MPKTLLLIGADGFLGAHVREAAEAAGAEVALASRGHGCDLLDRASIEGRLRKTRPDAIVNAAGSASVAASWEQPAKSFAVNAAGALNLLEATSREAPNAHLLCISSAAVYGQPGAEEMPLGEDAAPAPVSPYGAAKVAMEALCGQYTRARGLRIAVLRAFNLLGPGQAPFHAASGFARQIAEGERSGATELELAVGNPGAARDYLDVRDAARALVEVSRGELEGTYNLCSGQTLTVSEVIEGLAGATQLEVRARRDPALARPSDPPALRGDPARLREAIGCEPSISPERSLADLLDWWRRQAEEN